MGMIYELHTTAQATNTCDWIKLCKFIGVKPLIIRLSHGEHPEQFMCSYRFPGDTEMVKGYQKWLEQKISAYGLEVLRTKVEIPLDQYDNWLRDYQEGGEALYLESHIRIDASKDEEQTLEACKTHNLALSHSVLKGNLWATQRLIPGETFHPPTSFKATYNMLELRKVPVIDMHMEAVLGDTNSALDAGWINFDLQKGYVAA